MSPTPPAGFRRVEISLHERVAQKISVYAASNNVSVTSLMRAITEAWAENESLQESLLPRARELEAESRRRRGGGQMA